MRISASSRPGSASSSSSTLNGASFSSTTSARIFIGRLLCVWRLHAESWSPLFTVLSRFASDQGEGLSALIRKRSRSEEHTSELQSRENPVCRLLLEKKHYRIENPSIFEPELPEPAE